MEHSSNKKKCELQLARVCLNAYDLGAELKNAGEKNEPAKKHVLALTQRNLLVFNTVYPSHRLALGNVLLSKLLF